MSFLTGPENLHVLKTKNNILALLFKDKYLTHSFCLGAPLDQEYCSEVILQEESISCRLPWYFSSPA